VLAGPVIQLHQQKTWQPQGGFIWAIWTELNVFAVEAYCETGEDWIIRTLNISLIFRIATWHKGVKVETSQTWIDRLVDGWIQQGVKLSLCFICYPFLLFLIGCKFFVS